MVIWSSRPPELRNASTHFGCLPRPVHVLALFDGSRYFGGTGPRFFPDFDLTFRAFTMDKLFNSLADSPYSAAISLIFFNPSS